MTTRLVRLWAAALLCGLAPRAEAGKYSLPELVSKLGRDFPAVVAAREGVEAARAGLRAAQLQWLPAGEALLLLTGASKVQCLDRFDPANPATNTPNPDKALREANCVRTTVVSLTNTTSLADAAPIHGVLLRLDVNLNQPLYSFGRLEAGIAAARASLATAEATLEREQADAAWNVTRAFWGVKAAKAALETLSEGIDKLQEWTDKVDEQISGPNPSKYTESDLARLKVGLSYARTQRLDLERNLAYARQALRFLVADPEADVDDAELELQEIDDPEAAWLARAERERPEVRILRAGERWAASQRGARRSDLLPELSLASYLGVGYASSIDSPQNYYLNRPTYVNATFGLQLRQPLDLGVRAARFLQARHEERATRLRTQASQVTYASEVAKAYADYHEARGRARELGRGEKISRGWFHAVDTNMSTGLHTDGRELIESVQSYFTFRLRAFQAIHDANVALGWLRRTSSAPPRP